MLTALKGLWRGFVELMELQARARTNRPTQPERVQWAHLGVVMHDGFHPLPRRLRTLRPSDARSRGLKRR